MPIRGCMRFLNKISNSAKGIIQSLEISEVFASSGASHLPLQEFLKLVLGVLQGTDSVLVGGLALAEHAKPRATQDLDFVIVSKDMDDIVALFESKGFKQTENMPYNQPKRDIVKFEYEGREVDFLFFKSKEFATHLLKRAKQATILGKSVKIASAEDLVITKLASMRWKDKADIMAIRSKSDTLDLSYVRDRLWDLGITDRIQFLKLPVED